MSEVLMLMIPSTSIRSRTNNFALFSILVIYNLNPTVTMHCMIINFNIQCFVGQCPAAL